MLDGDDRGELTRVGVEGREGDSEGDDTGDPTITEDVGECGGRDGGCCS